MTFHVGQKVVYVGGLALHPGETEPSKNAVYTVIWVGHHPGFTHLHIDIAEMPCAETDEYFRGYKAVAFRPVVERKTDISVFQEILRKVSRKNGVDA